MVLSTEIQQQVYDLLSKTSNLSLVSVDQESDARLSLTPGQRVTAEVLIMLPDNRVQVRVGTERFNLKLPMEVRQGQTLEMTFVSENPRATFAIARQGTDTPGNSQISVTGRWLSGFLGVASEGLSAQATMGILRTLLSSPPVDASQVSTVLQHGLRESGLFYESHLARWFGGDYSLEDILREPQGRLSLLSRPGAAQVSGTLAEGLANAGIKNGSMEVMEAVFKKAGTVMGNEGIADQRSIPIIREQMDALQSGQVVYRGELFPGQPMEWTIQEREARRDAAGEQEHGWDTTMRLDLPRLGVVNARLTLNNNRVSIALNVDDADSAGLIESGRPELIEQLQAAGLIPGEIGVKLVGM